MIDTIRIRSPFLTESDAQNIEYHCNKKIGIRMRTGEIFYEFTDGELLGSFDYRIRFKVMREQWVYKHDLGYPEKVSTKPYIEIECSVHKLLYGHNLYGGIDNLKVAVHYVVNFCSDALEVDLPCFQEWEIVRVDYARNFNLGNLFAVRAYIKSLSTSEYPRRVARRSTYGEDTIMFTGTTTTIKVYNKYSEFKSHDFKRLIKNVYSIDECKRLLSFSEGILRVEVQVNSRKMEMDLGKRVITCFDVPDDYLGRLYESEVYKVLKVGEYGKLVRNTMDVRRVLSERYSPQKANILFATWCSLATIGEQATRESMSKSTFYRHRQELLNAGISWLGSDLSIVENSFPDDFVPCLESPYLVNVCNSDKVESLLQPSIMAVREYEEKIRRSA